MSTVLERIRELKTQAKNRRDLKRYDAAEKLLTQAIEIAQRELDTANAAEWKATLASELADCHGLLGGVARRWALEPDTDPDKRLEHLRDSVDAYDKGYDKFEANPEYGLANTYNALNRLLSRLLVDPGLLAANSGGDQGARAQSPDVRSELESIARKLEGQLATQRRGDFWALADLALINVLLGRQDAATAYTAFEAESPPDFAFRSALDGVTPLAGLDLPSAAQLKLAKERLERGLRSQQTR